MWQLKSISYFNIHENIVRYMLKFITTPFQIENFSHRFSFFLTRGFLYTNISLNKIYYCEYFDDAFLRVRKLGLNSMMKRIVKHR